MKPSTLLIALCCVVWLHGCATTPHVVTTPSVCPAKREQPAKIMGPLPKQLPALAESLPKNWGPDQAADALQKNRRESAAAYSACIDSRAGLIDWIRAEP
jgi:hypothetical protein